jgi:DNA-binding MarR family transcriptional regulator
MNLNQWEVLEAIRKKEEWTTSTEIAKEFDCVRNTITVKIKALEKFGYIKTKETRVGSRPCLMFKAI